MESERAAHGRSASAVAHYREASVVKLSIGGTVFTTSRSTLVPASCFFSVLLGGSFEPTRDSNAIFVDRDPTHFPKILAFLHDGAMPVWSDDGERVALEREAEFYQIEALERCVCPATNMVACAGPTNERMRDAENELRALFVSARDDPRISHPHTHLVDVFSSLTTFVGGGVQLEELRDVPTLARFRTHRPAAAGAPSVVPSMEVFRRHFSSFAGGLLDGFDWTNLVAAGSSALTPALPLPRRPETWRGPARTDADYERLCYLHVAALGLDEQADLDFVNDDLRFFEDLQRQYDEDPTVPEDERGDDAPSKDIVDAVRDVPVSTSDVDLFIHGVEDDEAQALAIIRRVHKHLLAKCPADGYVTAWRGRHARTFHCGTMKVSRINNEGRQSESHWCPRRIQVVFRLYKSIAEVLMGFDLDASGFGYDGSRLWCLPRARRAVNGRINVVDPSRQSVSYETRLLKYAERGFAVAVPGLDPRRIDASVMFRPWHEVNGLARLLCVIKRRQDRVDRISVARDLNSGGGWEQPRDGQALCEHKGGQRSMAERVTHWFGCATARGIDPAKPDGNALMCAAPDAQSGNVHGWRNRTSLFQLLKALNLVDAQNTPDRRFHRAQQLQEGADPFEASDYEDTVVDGRTTSEVLRALGNKSFWRHGTEHHPFDATRCRRLPIVVTSTRGDAVASRIHSDFGMLVDTPPSPLVVDLPGLGSRRYRYAPTGTLCSYVSSLSRRVEWITVDPGRQYIGSFRPLDNDWLKDAYLANGAVKFSDDLIASFSTPTP